MRQGPQNSGPFAPGAPFAPFAPFLDRHGVVVLDGGLATELERRGHDIDHPLWSAQVLRTAPEAVREVHRAYLAAGADCITAATYQASLPGLTAVGVSVAESRRLLVSAVRLAREARDEHADSAAARSPPPLVAASIGPYGAYLADGSEYTGRYGVSAVLLRAFHEPRWEILATAGADLLACETIPSLAEAEVLRALLEDAPHPAWVSFSCRDEGHISDGTPIESCVSLFADCGSVLALGVNCTAPPFVEGLIARIRRATPAARVVVYPNSGEVYDAARRSWTGLADPVDFADCARRWVAGGATLIGGCCRTTPHHIRALRQALVGD